MPNITFEKFLDNFEELLAMPAPVVGITVNDSGMCRLLKNALPNPDKRIGCFPPSEIEVIYVPLQTEQIREWRSTEEMMKFIEKNTPQIKTGRRKKRYAKRK